MPQYTGHMPMACGQVETSTTGEDESWLDVSGGVQSVQDTEQTRKSGEAYTISGDTAAIGAGKREPMELTFVILYTETDAELYQVARTQFETACGGDFYVRWSPGGGNIGDERITSGLGILIGFTYPPLDASSGGPILGGFKVKVPSVTTAVIAS